MPLRSHITQVMQNYLDATDRRSRENPTSLEVQLLNISAVELENLSLRAARETSQSFQSIPTNIDNQGIYFGYRAPDFLLTGPDQTQFVSIVGSKDGILRTLKVYDDTLPIPTRIELDPDSTIAINPLVFTLTGSGDDRVQQYTVQYATIGVLPIPNKLTLWLDQLGLNEAAVSITITGETAPQPAWTSERRKSVEAITVFQEGIAVSRNRWAVIDKVAVRGLPLGARLQGYSMPFGLPAASDVSRPYTTPEDRDVLYSRYWQISNSDKLLKEMFMAEGFTGLVTINSYSLNGVLVDTCVEPNTNGMYVASSTTLYYMDRREVLPDLSQTGFAQEPLYGLQVSYDITKQGPVRYASLSGIAYANSASVFQYRYIVNSNSVLPDGSLGPADTGWRGGAPQPVSIPLLATGDYQFRLECQDGNGNLTYDTVPFRNPAFTPLASLDLSSLIDVAAGIGFDSYGSLWIWNGLYATKAVLHYDAYVFDADTKTIFTTDQFDSLQVS